MPLCLGAFTTHCFRQLHQSSCVDVWYLKEDLVNFFNSGCHHVNNIKTGSLRAEHVKDKFFARDLRAQFKDAEL